MDLWLILTIVAAILGAFSGFVDNFIVDNFFRGKTPQAQKCFDGPAYAMFALLLFITYLIFFRVDHFSTVAALLLFLSGVISSISSIPYYLALKSENTTGAAIFSQLMPVIYLILGAIFLNETITGVSLVAFIMLLCSPLIVVFSTRKRGKKLEYRAAIRLLLYIIIFAISRVVFVIAERNTGASESLPFPLAIAFLLAGKGCFDIVLSLIMKKWRTRFKRVVHDSKKKVLVPLAVNTAIWVIIEFVYNSATMTGQVATVSAVCSSVQLIATFAFGLAFTIVWPRFGLEKLDRKTVAAHLLATIISVIGIILINQPEILIGG